VIKEKENLRGGNGEGKKKKRRKVSEKELNQGNISMRWIIE